MSWCILLMLVMDGRRKPGKSRPARLPRFFRTAQRRDREIWSIIITLRTAAVQHHAHAHPELP